MTAIDELIAHYRTLHAQMLEDIASLESGTMTLWEIQEGKRVNYTSEWVKDQKRRADDLARIIKAYERRQS